MWINFNIFCENASSTLSEPLNSVTILFYSLISFSSSKFIIMLLKGEYRKITEQVLI